MTGNKSKITFIYLDNIFLKMYNTMIYKMNIFLYNIKYNKFFKYWFIISIGSLFTYNLYKNWFVLCKYYSWKDRYII